MADTKQPTILIKKADGTMVRVSLDEFKKIKSGQQTTDNRQQTADSTKIVEEKTNSKAQMLNQIQMTNVKSDVVENKEEKINSVTLIKKEQETVVEDSLMIETPHELATTSPVTDIFLDEAAANFEWNEKDHKSLLEEDNTEVENLKKQGNVHVGAHDLQEHIKMPSVAIDDDLKNRAKSLVISWKKGIRNNNQFLDYATRDINHGGLGLDMDQANRFLEKSKDSKVNLDNLFEIVFEKKAKKEEMIILEPVKQREEIVQTNIIDNSIVEFSKPYSHVSPISVVHDVLAPQFEAKTLGPKQEIAEFSLIDYRRLARDPKKCADMLLSKFVGWKEESFLLFLDTLVGWQTSPLYNMYVGTTVEAINSNMTVIQVLQSKDSKISLTLEEYESLIEINSKLNNY